MGEVGSSNVPSPTNYLWCSLEKFGALAQLGVRLPCTQEVSGSIPLGSTMNLEN